MTVHQRDEIKRFRVVCFVAVVQSCVSVASASAPNVRSTVTGETNQQVYWFENPDISSSSGYVANPANRVGVDVWTTIPKPLGEDGYDEVFNSHELAYQGNIHSLHKTFFRNVPGYAVDARFGAAYVDPTGGL